MFYFIHVIVSFSVIKTKSSWTINNSSSCTVPFIIFYDSFIIKPIRLVIHQSFDKEEDDLNFSTHLSPYIKKYGFSISYGIWWKTSVSQVEILVHVHKFVRRLELLAWETHTTEHTFVNQQCCECSSHSFLHLPDFLFPWVYLHFHRAIYCLF